MILAYIWDTNMYLWLQLMAILAFATTAGFSTECEFNVPCTGSKEDDKLVSYDIEYPFS